jgi:hypothetical protein
MFHGILSLVFAVLAAGSTAVVLLCVFQVVREVLGGVTLPPPGCDTDVPDLSEWLRKQEERFRRARSPQPAQPSVTAEKRRSA